MNAENTKSFTIFGKGSRQHPILLSVARQQRYHDVTKNTWTANTFCTQPYMLKKIWPDNFYLIAALGSVFRHSFTGGMHSDAHTLHMPTCTVLLHRKGLVFREGSVRVCRQLISEMWRRGRVTGVEEVLGVGLWGFPETQVRLWNSVEQQQDPALNDQSYRQRRLIQHLYILLSSSWPIPFTL